MNNAQLINQTSGECEYYTPPLIIEAARLTMGEIDLDPASSEAANAIVKAKHFKDQHGLSGDWFGRVWLNHPFGRAETACTPDCKRGLKNKSHQCHAADYHGNGPWIKKLVSEYELRNVVAACCITYACTSEQWFQPLQHYVQCYLYPRTNYLLPDGTVKRGVTKGSVVTYLGRDIRAFTENFRPLGALKMPV